MLVSAAQRLNLSMYQYVARLEPRCGSLALMSVVWYVLTVSQVGAMARFRLDLSEIKSLIPSVNIAIRLPQLTYFPSLHTEPDSLRFFFKVCVRGLYFLRQSS